MYVIKDLESNEYLCDFIGVDVVKRRIRPRTTKIVERAMYFSSKKDVEGVLSRLVLDKYKIEKREMEYDL